MPELTAQQLHQAMTEGLGTAGAAVPDDDFLDTRFTDLDFDSLAVLELFACIQQSHALRIPDGAAEDLLTPREVLDYVNRQLASA